MVLIKSMNYSGINEQSKIDLFFYVKYLTTHYHNLNPNVVLVLSNQDEPLFAIDLLEDC